MRPPHKHTDRPNAQAHDHLDGDGPHAHTIFGSVVLGKNTRTPAENHYEHFCDRPYHRGPE